jgi:hypothetical protein
MPRSTAAVPLAAVLLLCAASCTRAPSTFRVVRERCAPCELEPLVAQLSGPGALDCGWSRGEGDRAGVQACALKAAGEGRAFRAVFTLQGIDSQVAAAYVRTPGGELAQVWSDSNPSGGPGRCRGVVTRTACERLEADAAGRERLVCVGRGEQALLCDESQRRGEEGGEEDARRLACNPLPASGKAGQCLRLSEPEGNVPGGLRLTCEPLSAAAPNLLRCFDTEAGEVRRMGAQP